MDVGVDVFCALVELNAAIRLIILGKATFSAEVIHCPILSRWSRDKYGLSETCSRYNKFGRI